MSKTKPQRNQGPDRDTAGALLTAIVASSDDAIVTKDPNTIITSWNAGAERMFGFTAAEMIGQTILRIIPPERADEYRTIFDRVHQGERVTHFETECLTKDGRKVPVSISISPIFDAAGKQIGISAIARDLTELQRLNQELRVREALLQSTVDMVLDGLMVIDTKGIIQSFSPPAERTFGYSAAEAVGRNVSLLMPEAHARAHDGYLEHYLGTGERRIIGIGRVLLARRKDGTTFPMELQVGEIKASGAHLFVGFIRDLTVRQDRERRITELQAEVIHLSRLSDLGHMASAIAHEVNQPLAAIANYMGGIRRLLTDDTAPALRQAIEKVAEQAERARGIVRSLRDLVKKEPRPRQVENLEALIRETSALALIGTNRTISLDVHVASDAALCCIDKVQIQQVLLNLIRNAIEAVDGSARNHIAITAVRQGSRIALTVFDTGPGIPDTVRDTLFQPFRTTKKDGLGVGLSICRAIVEAHGSELTAENRPEGGARFRFTLPGPEEAADSDPGVART